MSIRRVKACLLTAAAAGLFGLSATPASAFGGKSAGLFNRNKCCDPCATAAPACGGCGTGAATAAPAAAGRRCPRAVVAAPATRTIKVTEMVPTWVDEVRTVYKNESKQETYTAQRYENVQEQRTRNVTVNRQVTETVMETRTDPQAGHGNRDGNPDRHEARAGADDGNPERDEARPGHEDGDGQRNPLGNPASDGNEVPHRAEHRQRSDVQSTSGRPCTIA